MAGFSTADLWDAHEDHLQVAEALFGDFGGRAAFGGQITTVRTFEDNSQVRAALEEQGRDRVLVVDGGGSLRCALIGDRLATLAAANGWSGILVNGCIRDSAVLASIEIGVKALATCPRKSARLGAGERDVEVRFAGVSFRPGEYLYADRDGVVVSHRSLLD